MADQAERIEMQFEITDAGLRQGGRRSRRVAAGVGAAMLVAVAGGVGFGIGRNLDDASGQTVAPLDQPETEPNAEPVPQTVPDSTTLPIATGETSPADGGTDVTDREEAVEEMVAGSADFQASGAGGWATFGDSDMDLLTERLTNTGVVLRAHLGPTWEQEQWIEPGTDGWQPPAWCFESGQVRIALGGGETTGPNVIDTGSVNWWSQPFKGRAVSWVTLGRVDGNPHRVIFVQAPEGTTEVTATFGDGVVDTAIPNNGVALLVAAGAPDSTEFSDGGGGTNYQDQPDFTIEFAGPELVIVDQTQIGGWNDPEFAASCSPPPPALPEAGEQPADSDAAETEVAELMAGIYGDNEDIFDSLDFIDDPTGVAEARDQVAEGGFEEAAANAEAIVEELVFTTPVDAWFRYRIETTTGNFSERFGQAVVIDGIWKITRATICQDLQLAGGSCGTGVDQIRPPGFEYDY
ncbi:MAG: hypothetical protein ACJAR2_002242 [Ilumatobacter sp.]|jgi:hypothetical protein